MLLYGVYGNKFNWFILLNIYLLPNSVSFVRNSLYNSSWMFIYDIVISELMRLKSGFFYFFSFFQNRWRRFSFLCVPYKPYFIKLPILHQKGEWFLYCNFVPRNKISMILRLRNLRVLFHCSISSGSKHFSHFTYLIVFT